MYLRVPGAGGAVDITGGEEAVALDELMTPGAAAGPTGHLLQVVEPRLHGLRMGRCDLGPDRRAAERPGK